MKRSLALILSCAALGAVTAVASARPQTSSQSSSSATTTHKSTVHHATTSPSGIDPALLHPSTLRAKAPDEFQVKFETTKGDFVIEATRAWAPNGVDRFYNLVKHGFFTDVSFYRVVPGFVVQFGMSPSPRVTAALTNSTIKDDPVTQSNKPWTVTFAKPDAPDARTTVLFINLADNSQLDGHGFPPIGRVTSGMDVIQEFYSGYGDLPEMQGHGPSQDRMAAGGKAYLDKNFPNLDSIKMATIISQTPAPAAAKKPATTHTTAKKPAASSSSSQN